MASSSHQVRPNFRDVIAKMAAIRLSDATPRDTTDYAEIICGDGAPSGAYGRDSDATMLYFRKDASSVATWAYVTVNGGTAWTALDPAAVLGASITINDTFALQFGTPGTDLVLTADGTDVIVTSTGDLVFNDSVDLKIGTGKDIGIAWDGTDLIISQAAADSWVKWGASGAGINHLFYGDTAGRDLSWDQTNDQLLFADNAKLAIGSGAGGAGDITFSWNATKMLVAQLTANSAIDWGVDGAGIDQVWYTDTASQSFTLDQSADAIVMTAAVSIKGQGSTVVPVLPIAAQQNLTGSGAIGITSYYTAWNTTGGGAGTLANGAQIGQLKKVQLIVDGGDGTLTPTSLSGGTTITFADAGDFAVLCWNGTAWVAIELGNDADGATAPVLA